ncbi:hypothetical protein JL100_005910 [Skermanella mucosa]|uniref:hypothetical protein n=1 Tax=Skermanella mucosa TaxID=1789672 RepID=UPI00192C695E|nr:hypothetical protein [Skermanella mucosa]UEM22283.1 hypothetical protein JL100_005910 [Skermanella mucosa]
MPPRVNPLKLNPLQLKTLTLLQELGRLIGTPAPDEGEGALLVNQFPHAHGNHFHMGDAVVSTADANGLSNPAVWVALERKGLIKSRFPHAAVITLDGMGYDTGLSDKILHRSDH